MINVRLTAALPKDAEEHIKQLHIIAPPTKAGFCVCSCGISFRVGFIINFPDSSLDFETEEK